MIPRFLTWNARRREQFKRRETEARGFDLAWGRWLVTIALSGLGLAWLWVASTRMGAVTGVGGLLGTLAGYALSIVAYAGMAFNLGLLLYFCHLLFRSIRCSLLEWCLLIFGLGFTQWMAVQLPGISEKLDTLAFTGTFLAGIVVYGMVIGLAEAELLSLKGPSRVIFIFLGWWTAVAPAMIIVAAGLCVVDVNTRSMLVSDDMKAWIIPLFILGGLGLVANIVVTSKASRAARLALGELGNSGQRENL